jgi:hypothetical protein
MPKIEGVAKIDWVRKGLLLRLDDKRREYKDQPFEYADYMLRHWNFPADERGVDVQKKFEDFIDELDRMKAKLDAKDQARVQALVATREAIRKPLAANRQDVDAVLKLPALADGGYRQLAKDHYVLLYPTGKDKMAEAKTKRLERLYAGFYYWFALHGQPLPQPDRQLVCVLADSVEKFWTLHKVFDSVEHVADGFYSAFDNVAILAPERVDAPYDQFKAKAGDEEKKLTEFDLTLTKLLKGERIKQKTMDDMGEFAPGRIAYGQMMALALEGAKEEGENATVTHEGTQQLAAASGLLPRRVRVPTAVRLGLGSFFETPKSSGELGSPSLWTGIGGENWVYLPLFKKLVKADGGSIKLDEKDTKAKGTKLDKLSILRVLSDRGFEKADRADKADQETLKHVARAEAWALTYYLARDKLDNLRKFYDELTKLPRDMELTPEIVEQCFGAAFGLLDENGKINSDMLGNLERDWKTYVGRLTFEEDPNRETIKEPKKPSN